MGFTPQRTQYRLKFADEGMAGLVVTMSSASIGDLMDLQNVDPENTTAADLSRMLGILDRALISWNVENEGGSPVPANLDGLRTLDVSFVMAIMSAWTEAITGVTPPLPGSSTSGETFQEVTLPMAPLSPNPVS